ncbi:lipopolysaccharide assembly protein LapA domain-containing protein [Bacillus spongiae]|uniref:Lipopolysaccharide assembly protein LapA domain-containing protein n=1 Tax=Bacillus spongiae TaxID=2683610 RepID=A0ABU8H918_9BACI
MKFQWTLLFSFVFAIIVAVFAVINVEHVSVNYLLGSSEWPLILVILGSALLGGLIVGAGGMVKVFNLQRQTKLLIRENEQLRVDLFKGPQGEDLKKDERSDK